MSLEGSHRFATACGPVAVQWTALGIARVRLIEFATGGDAEPGEGVATLPPLAADCVRRVVACLAGEPVDFSDLALDETGIGSLETAIYRELRRVPRGSTVTYGELAARVGAPKAAQAVGAAMARNPWPIVVPCHRVLAAGGRLGGFSAPGGARTKRRLLRMEGVDLDHGMALLPGLFDEA